MSTVSGSLGEGIPQRPEAKFDEITPIHFTMNLVGREVMLPINPQIHVRAMNAHPAIAPQMATLMQANMSGIGMAYWQDDMGKFCTFIACAKGKLPAIEIARQFDPDAQGHARLALCRNDSPIWLEPILDSGIGEKTLEINHGQ